MFKPGAARRIPATRSTGKYSVVFCLYRNPNTSGKTNEVTCTRIERDVFAMSAVVAEIDKVPVLPLLKFYRVRTCFA